MICGHGNGEVIRTYTTAFVIFENKSPHKHIQTVTTPGGTNQGYWWGCYSLAVDLRKKPRSNTFLIVLSFAQNATWWAGRVIKITRNDANSKWNDDPKT